MWQPILGDACEISNEEAWKRVTAEDPASPMWQLPHYADGAYAIIGRAIESVTGMSYEDYVVNHIFKPLGMDSSYLKYNSWSEMAKRTVPGRIGNTTLPSFMAHADLNWARPTGNAYSTVTDLAKLVSVFMVGNDESKNPLGIYSSTLRQMLSPSFLNDDQFTGYSYPWEFYHSSIYGDGVPSYWVRQKVGAMPGYTSMITLFPEIKTTFILQTNGAIPRSTYGAVATMLTAMEETLWDLQPKPANPGNLTSFSGTYIASALYGYIIANTTVVADETDNQLKVYFSLSTTGNAASIKHAVWKKANDFVILPPSDRNHRCMEEEAGFTNVVIHFKEAVGWDGSLSVVSLEIPDDPYYGWTFVKK